MTRKGNRKEDQLRNTYFKMHKRSINAFSKFLISMTLSNLTALRRKETANDIQT